MDKQQELINILVHNDIVSSTDIARLEAEAKKDRKKIDELLVRDDLIAEEKLVQIKAKLYELPYQDLTETEIEEGILNTISSEVAENYKIICFDKNGIQIKVGIIDPENFKAIEAVDFLAKGNGLEVEYHIISQSSFEEAFKHYKSLAKELTSALESKAHEEEELTRIEDKDQLELAEVTKSAPVAKIVSVIIRHAVEGGASDIHIEPSRKESRVRYRIDGVLHTSLVLPRSVHNSIVARIKVMANLKLDESRIPQDGRIRLVISDKEIDFRVSILPLVNAEKVVMRILDTTKGAPKLVGLGYQGHQLKVIEENMKKTEGLLLITGPTGSGKSTTLFSALDILNQEGVNISTLEDPVEYQMKGVNQSQIRPEIGYTFAAGLRSFLRQDPDVIMVGEIRDQETAELAIHAALTGHFVLSTLHTTSAPGAITRMVDMHIEPFLVGSTLHTVIAQRLTRRICSSCKEEIKIPAELAGQLKKDITEIGNEVIKETIPDWEGEIDKIYQGKGCPHCGNTGYKGRLAISEVVDINEKLKTLILDGHKHITESEIKATQPYSNMYQDGIIKVLQGLTTLEEVLRVMKT